jgi:hypothetical protein
MNGRTTSTLTATQQTAAASLGFTTALPEATGAVLMQGGTLGTVAGSNSRTLTQANLPAVNLSTSHNLALPNHDHAIEDMGHVHHVTVYRSNGAGVESGFGRATDIDDQSYLGSVGAEVTGIKVKNPTSLPAITGSVTTPLGGSGTALDITPKSLSVNMFVYLGAA